MMPRKPTFRDLSGPLRRQIAKYFRACREKDRESTPPERGWASQSRSLQEYFFRLGIMPTYLEAVMAAKLSASDNLRCLEVGVGKGAAIREWDRRYGAGIRFDGIALTYSRDRVLPHYRHRVGVIETLRLEEKVYDFVFSVRGGFVYSLESFSASQEVLNSLKAEGMAFLEDGRLLFPQDWFREFLGSRGFEVTVTRFEEGRPQAYKIVRRQEGGLDLSAFSARYLRLIQEREQEFLRWGFDRMNKAAPLDRIFAELYSEAHYQGLF